MKTRFFFQQPSRHSFHSFSRKGFTLIEITVVLLIIGILAALTIPTVSRVARAANLSSTGSHLKDQCILARQIAISKNAPVEVRLYKLPAYNATNTATPGVYRAVQLFLVSDKTNAVDKADFFRSPVVVSTGTNESALLGDTAHTNIAAGTNDPSLGVFGKNYQYVAFRFLPGGGTDLASGKDFITLVIQDDKGVAQGGNFYTVQIDPVNGVVRSYRP